MLFVLLGIIALICMICAGVKNKSANKKRDAIKKYNDDYDQKLEHETIEIRQKYYNSNATREIADYILADKSEPPFKVRIDSVEVTAAFPDGSSVCYCYRAHGLQPPLETEIVSPSYDAPRGTDCDRLRMAVISHQHEFVEALRLRILDQYNDIDYCIDSYEVEICPGGDTMTITYLHRVPTKQF